MAESMIRNIIWDLDGTLFDTYPPIAGAFQQALKSLGKEAPAARIEALARVSLSHCAADLSAEYDLAQEAVEQEFTRCYREVSAEESPPFPGAAALCDYILSLGGINLIVTHRGRESTWDLLNTHQLADRFTEVIVREEDYPRKPDPTVFLAMLDKHDLVKHETISVGDRALDIQAGNRAEIFTCLYGTSIDQGEPDLVFDDYADLQRFILEKNNTTIK